MNVRPLALGHRLTGVLLAAIADLEYYAAYDPDVINCAIAMLFFKPLEWLAGAALERGMSRQL